MLSKADLVHDEAILSELEAALADRGITPRRISAAASQGLDALLLEVFDAVDAARTEDETAKSPTEARR